MPSLEKAQALFGWFEQAGHREISKVGAAGDLVLKIGVHAGPCIAVESNDRLDYFGQTVNIAARVQGIYRLACP